MSNAATWGEAVQLDQSSGLWYKFKQNSNGDWEILCSGDRNSLDSNSVIYHDHYWQSNGKWYFQGKRGDTHIIGRDNFLEDLRSRNQNGTLNLSEDERQLLGMQNDLNTPLTQPQIKSIADYRANQAYGNSGYEGNTHGIEVSSYSDSASASFDRQVQEYQQLNSGGLIWRNSLTPTSEAPAEFNWREDTDNLNRADNNELSSVPRIANQNQKGKSARRANRKN